MLVGDGTESSDWPHKFELIVSFILLEKELRVNMKVENTGQEPLKFTTLLHTYIRVGDVRNTSVKGFKGKQYKTENEATPGTFTDDREIATFQCETDRIYTDCSSQEIEIDEQGGRPGGKMTVLNSEEKN